jgi:Holliday junction DNA helicase RuvA
MSYDKAMIGHLRGQIIHKSEKHLFLEVAGVAYKVAVTPTTRLALSSDSPETGLWTYLAVKDDALDLYGFPEHLELEFFELLLTISGVGPKSALNIISQASPETLAQAVNHNDTSYLTKVSGLGQKLAEKIVRELKDKVPAINISDHQNIQQNTDVMLALQAMGYTERDVRESLKHLPTNISDTGEKIKFALKNLK